MKVSWILTTITIALIFTPKPEGGIEFWQVLQKPKPGLQRTGYVVNVGRGMHQLLVAR